MIRVFLALWFTCWLTPLALAASTEQLMAQIPQDWIKVVDRKAGTLHIAEYYPPQTGETWQQKLTIEALSGSDLPDPIVFAEGLAEQQSRVCNDFSNEGVFAGFENGYPATVHIMVCGNNKRTGRSLVTVLKVIKGNDALYTITRIWRFDPPPQDPEKSRDDDASLAVPIDQSELGAWSATLRSIKVCDPALPAHPCDTTDRPDSKPDAAKDAD